MSMLSASNNRKRRRMSTGNSPGEEKKKGKTISAGNRCTVNSHQQPYHDHMVHVRGVSDKPTTGSQQNLELAGDSNNTSNATTELVFPCCMSESWRESFQTYRPPKDILLEHKANDRVLAALKGQGFRILHTKPHRNAILATAFSKRTPENKLVMLKFASISDGAEASDNIKAIQQTSYETNIYQSLNHPNIVEMYDCFCVNSARVLSVAYCQRGTLQSLLETRDAGFLPEAVARPCFQEMLGAIQYIHALCIAHCDLKPSHFLIDHHDRIKLCDFSSARRCRAGDKVLHSNDKPLSAFQPEEVHLGSLHDPRAADIWSLGATLYKLLTSRDPCRETIEADIQKVSHLSPQAAQIITSMCQRCPENRPLAANIPCSAWLAKSNQRVAIGMCQLTRYPLKIDHSR